MINVYIYSEYWGNIHNALSCAITHCMHSADLLAWKILFITEWKWRKVLPWHAVGYMQQLFVTCYADRYCYNRIYFRYTYLSVYTRLLYVIIYAAILRASARTVAPFLKFWLSIKLVDSSSSLTNACSICWTCVIVPDGSRVSLVARHLSRWTAHRCLDQRCRLQTMSCLLRQYACQQQQWRDWVTSSWTLGSCNPPSHRQ